MPRLEFREQPTKIGRRKGFGPHIGALRRQFSSAATSVTLPGLMRKHKFLP
jgi:hypothetical protein